VPDGALGGCAVDVVPCDSTKLSRLVDCPEGMYCSFGLSKLCGAADAYCPVNSSRKLSTLFVGISFVQTCFFF
jgi:hypothetical protein